MELTDIERIRNGVDMVALVGDHVKLERRGGNHVGTCPFCKAEPVSFNVSAANRFFHCFKCKESGDPFAFMMRVRGLSFPQAVAALSGKPC